MIKYSLFASGLGLINNQPNTTNVIGELSPLSRTYEPGDLSTYYDVDSDLVLYAFSGHKTAQDSQLINEDDLELILTLIKEMINGTRTLTQVTPDHLALYIREQYIPSQASETLNDLSMTPLIYQSGHRLPGRLNFTINGRFMASIWFSDAAFQDQYEPCTLKVIAPVNDPNVFTQSLPTVSQALNAKGLDGLLAEAQRVKGDYPYTALRMVTLAYHSPYTQLPINTTWLVVVYGARGDHLDGYKDQIIQYLLSQSQVTEDKWTQYFPELFKRREYIIHPNWNQFAIPSGPTTRGINQSIQNATQVIDQFIQTANFLPIAHIKEHLVTLPFSYKWYNLSIVQGLYNVAGTDGVVDLLPDYIPVSMTHIDFNRMSEQTQRWVQFMNDLLIQAEDLHQHSVSFKAYIVLREGRRYYSAVFQGINHLVSARVQP